MCKHGGEGSVNRGSRSTSSVDGRPDGRDPDPGQRTTLLPHVCVLGQRLWGGGLDTNLPCSQLNRDAAKRTLQITSLQAFSKYSVADVYLNGSTVPLPSPTLLLTVAFMLVFCPLSAKRLWNLSGGRFALGGSRRGHQSSDECPAPRRPLSWKAP